MKYTIVYQAKNMDPAIAYTDTLERAWIEELIGNAQAYESMKIRAISLHTDSILVRSVHSDNTMSYAEVLALAEQDAALDE